MIDIVSISSLLFFCRRIMNNFAAIDFETANFNRSSVCSVGVVIYQDGIKVDEIYEYIKPAPNHFEQRCIDVHGILPFQVENAPLFPQVWAKIEPKVAGLPLVAHNMSFDRSCLFKVCDYYGMPHPDHEYLCTCQAAKRQLPNLPNHTLDTLASYYKISLNHHHALSDAQACAQLALRLL